MAIDNLVERARKEEDINSLREWLDKQPHLPKEIDADLLKSFVNGTKSLERAKKKLDNYFTTKGKFLDVFQIRITDLLSENSKEAIVFKMFFLPKATQEGYRILFVSYTNEDLEKYSFSMMVTKLVMMLEVGMHIWPEMTGLCTVCDVKNLPNSYLTKISIPGSAASIRYFQDGYPVKFKKGIAINIPKFVDVLLNVILKPFISSKLSSRISLHDGDVCDEHYDVDLLPSEYGGKEDSIHVLDQKWHEILLDHRDWLENNFTLIADETKRPPEEESRYGPQGSFKSLAVD